MSYIYEEYVPQLGDKVKLSELGRKWAGGMPRFTHPRDFDMIGLAMEIVDVSTKTCCCESEVKINWMNGLKGQYPMSFLDKSQ